MALKERKVVTVRLLPIRSSVRVKTSLLLLLSQLAPLTQIRDLILIEQKPGLGHYILRKPLNLLNPHAFLKLKINAMLLVRVQQCLRRNDLQVNLSESGQQQIIQLLAMRDRPDSMQKSQERICTQRVFFIQQHVSTQSLNMLQKLRESMAVQTLSDCLHECLCLAVRHFAFALEVLHEVK